MAASACISQGTTSSTDQARGHSSLRWSVACVVRSQQAGVKKPHDQRTLGDGAVSPAGLPPAMQGIYRTWPKPKGSSHVQSASPQRPFQEGALSTMTLQWNASLGSIPTKEKTGHEVKAGWRESITGVRNTVFPNLWCHGILKRTHRAAHLRQF